MINFFRKKNEIEKPNPSSKLKTISPEFKTVSPQRAGLSFEVANLQGMGKREYQEDAFCVANVFDEEKLKKQGLLFAVCDGMGGLNAGGNAANMAIEIIRSRFFEMNPQEDISKYLRESLEIASLKINEQYQEKSGTTGIVGVIFDGKLHFASVGDSYLCLLRNNVAIRLNRPHNLQNKIYDECIANDEWNPFLARNNVEKDALTNFLGTAHLADIDSTVKPIELLPKDVILVCSDGAAAFADENELRDILIPTDAMESSRRIENKIEELNNPNQDNYTAIVICAR